MDPAQQFQNGAQGSGNAMGGGGGFAGGPPPGMGRGAIGLLPGGPLASIVIIALFAITLVVLAIVFYRLFARAGMNSVLGLLMLVPVVNLGVALYLAFAEWPVHAELARVKLQAASATLPSTAVVPPPVAPTTVDPTARVGA